MIKTLLKSFGCLLGFVIGISLAILLVLSLCFSLMRGNSALEIVPNTQGIKEDLGKTNPLIVEIKLQGVIASTHSTAENIKDILVECENGAIKDRVKGLLLYVNSPGGELVNSYEIYSALQAWKLRTSCPVYVYVEGLCASGAYYISCAADKIYTSDIGLVGSVGVVSGPFFNVKEALTKIGVEALVLSAGKEKASLSPFREWTEAEQKMHQNLLDFFYTHFLDVVLKSRRHLTKDFLVNTLGSQVVPPKQALEYGLVDGIGASRDSVLYDLVKELGIQDNYRVVGFDKSQMFKKFFLSASASPLFSGKMKHELVSPEASGQLNYGYIYEQNS